MIGLIAITLYKVVNFSLKAKPLNLRLEPFVRSLIVIFIFSFVAAIESAQAQVERPVRSPAGNLPTRQDTLRPGTLTNKKDTLIAKADTTKTQEKSDIETTIVYSARDSINSNLQQKIVKLYGNAKVRYGDIELQAEEIIIDYNLSTISAKSRVDTTGKAVGYPIFINGNEKYETKDMVYNFKTKRAKISEVVTQQGDGFIHGDVVYKNEKNELFTIGNAYTTCNLTHPHFRIISKKVKAIPGDKLISGPFYMEFNDVPTPLGFAFGMFPAPQKSASGIIVPTYGEEGRRGFFLRNGGYFFDISDYAKLAITGDIYSKGGGAIYLNSNYAKRYNYTGAFNFSFTNNINTDNIESPTTTKDFRIMWSHSPQTKGSSRFSASVNAASSTYNQNNYLGVNTSQTGRIDNTTQNLSSNINYSQSFPGTPISLGVNLRHTQNLSTKQVDLPLPDLSLNVNNLYPFKNSQVMFLQNLSTRYTATAVNYITNNLGKITMDEKGNLVSSDVDSIAPFSLDNLPYFIKNGKKGVRHAIPLSTSFKLLKFFTFSPSLNYEERWYAESLTWAYDDSTKLYTYTRNPGFNRVYNYSGSMGMNTRIYGTYLSKNPNSRLRAIRHVINPSVSYSFQPDFSDPKYGYYQRFTTTDGVGRETDVLKSSYEGFVYGNASAGRSSALGFGINNNIEMKVRNAKDTVDRKISLFNTLGLSSSYNFLADSFKLANISISANTNILNDKINLNFGATLDPYEYRTIITDFEDSETGIDTIYSERRISRYAWHSGSLGRITSANFAFSTNINPKGRDKDNEMREKISKSDATDSEKKYFLQNPDAYVDFSIPWNLRISYNVNYTHSENAKPVVTQTVRFSGDFSLTEKWKIVYNSGFDFEEKEFTQTNISINRDLHCWQLSLNWVPFGRYQSYSFSIGVKSSMLQDLKLDRQRNFFDN